MRTLFLQVSRIMLLILLLFALVSSANSGEDKKRKQAELMFNKGLAAEGVKNYEEAIGFYRQAQILFPDTPPVHYHIAFCSQQVGKKSEAAAALKAFIAAGGEGKELAGAQKWLDDFLLPKLTAKQRKRWEEAEDKLLTQAELADAALGSDAPPDLTPAREAVEILIAIKREVPEFLPIYPRLGAAYEFLKDYQNAFESYDGYLQGYVKLGYPPTDLRAVRVRRDACASRSRTLAKALAKKRQDEEAQRQNVKKWKMLKLKKGSFCRRMVNA